MCCDANTYRLRVEHMQGGSKHGMGNAMKVLITGGSHITSRQVTSTGLVTGWLEKSAHMGTGQSVKKLEEQVSEWAGKIR